MIEDREHIVTVPASRMADLRKWLERPNAGFRAGPRVTFEAVEGGGILVRTKPFRSGS